MEDRIDSVEFQEANSERKYEIMVQSMIEAVEVATYGERRDKEKKQEDKEESTDEEMERKKIVARSSKKKNPVTWWDEECEKAIEDRKKALKRYCKEMNMENFIEYKRLRAVARKVIRQKKREF